jgi:hypothetical protein
MSPSFEAQEDQFFQDEVNKVKEWWKVSERIGGNELLEQKQVKRSPIDTLLYLSL